MRKVASVLLGFILLGALLACSPQSTSTTAVKSAPVAKAEPIKLKAVSPMPAKDVFNDIYRKFIEKVNERSKGEIFIDFLGGPETVGEYGQGEALMKGVIDMSHLYAGAYTGQVLGAQTTLLSRLTPWEERESGFFQLMVDNHKKANLAYLGRGFTNGPFHMFVNKEVKKPQVDFKGLKLSTGGSYEPIMKPLGATGVFMATADRYDALQKGVIDGAAQPIASTVDMRWHEILKYAIEPGWSPASNVFYLMNLDSWNRIPPHLQKVMQDAAQETEREGWEYYEKINKDKWKVALDAGMKVITFSPDDAKWFLDTIYDSLWEKEAAALGPELTAKVKKMVTK